MDFGDTVDGARSLHAEVWRGVAGGSGPEGSDGAGDEETQAVLRCDVQDVVQPYEKQRRRIRTQHSDHT